MTVAQQKRLLRRTIARLEVHPDRVGIVYYLADGKTSSMSLDLEPWTKSISSIDSSENNLLQLKRKKPADSNLPVPFSRVVNIGDRGRT